MRTRTRSVASTSPRGPSSPVSSPSTMRKRSASTDKSPIQRNAPVTPRRRSKRVRFSDFGEDPLSSGLTPMFYRSSLSRKPDQPPGQTKHGVVKEGPLPTPESSPLPQVNPIQYTPFKQVLNDRTKRRLRRSHLSEETNDFESSQRLEAKQRRQAVDVLRHEVVEKEQRIDELMLELEEQRLRGIEVYDEEQTREELEWELENLKQQLSRNHVENEVNSCFTDVNASEVEMGASNSDTGCIWDDDIISSPSRHHPLARSSSMPARTTAPASKMTGTATQASEPDKQFALRIADLEQLLNQRTKMAEDAKVALETLHKELHTLGFSTSTTEGNVASLTAAAATTITTIRETLRQARLDLEYLLPGETSSGLIEGKQLLESLFAHLKMLLQKVKSSQQTTEVLQQSQSSLRRQFNVSLENIADLKDVMLQKQTEHEQITADILSNRTQLIADVEEKTQQLEACRDKLSALEQQAAKDADHIDHLNESMHESERESSVAITRLQSALEQYRGDIMSLEALVHTMEQDKLTLEQRIQHVDASAQEYERQRAQEVERLSRLKRNLDDTNATLTSLKQECANEADARRREVAGLTECLRLREAEVTEVRRGAAEYRALVEGVVLDCCGKLGLSLGLGLGLGVGGEV